MLDQLKQQFMLPQLGIGVLETGFNHLIKRSSPHCLATLRKLNETSLSITLLQPEFRCVIVFSESQTNWLANYEGTPNCSLTLQSSVLPKLADKSQLTTLINNQTLLLEGDIQVLQHFVQLLDELEKNPAELLSPFIGDVVAQSTVDITKGLFHKVRQQCSQTQAHLVDNLIHERPVLVHQLEIANFCEEVTALEKSVLELEMKINKK